MANLLTGLGYDGLNFLLGMKHTSGTVPDALPPPRSALVSSAMKPYRPNAGGIGIPWGYGCWGVEKSSDGWWGSFSGSDSDKNRLASDVINRLLSNCSWMNVHLIKPYECVFEIRVPEGYGA
ncbi:hypothetical protein J5N97_012605 [Dioscorea zingiberensis]|uniref:Uncharacterized protein n=1 Tax=Dioscorea zingiberensis TaxID=325984 RepID=A0A9D5HHV9_9LILI|nr:hypothetical protein J5N97_012605 [Dioscorea zingiberensis]